jgi:hypothetical protein
MAKAEVDSQWYELGSSEAPVVEVNQPQLIDCPLNPLDIPRQRLFSYDVIPMPPVSLLANPSVTGACCRLGKERDSKLLPLNMDFFAGEGTGK